MKIQTLFIPVLKREITYLIGQNAQDNFDMLDEACDGDIWFHVDSISSCHVIAKIPQEEEKEKEESQSWTKKQWHKILVQGAVLCKQNTKKVSHLPKVDILYTKVKNVTKSEPIGSVIALQTKVIRV